MAIWGAEHLAGRQMTVDGPFEVTLAETSSLLVGGVRFEPLPGGETPLLKEVGRIQMRVALTPLLRGLVVVKDLEVDDVIFTHQKSGSTGKARAVPLKWLWRLLTPVVERVALNHWQIDFTDIMPGRTDQFLLRHLTLDDIDNSGPLFLQGTGRVNADDFRIAGQMGGTLALFEERHPFPIDLQFTLAQFQATLSGAIDHPMDGQGFNLKVAIEEQELANFLQVFNIDTPPLGRFTFIADLAGDIEDLRSHRSGSRGFQRQHHSDRSRGIGSRPGHRSRH